MTEDDPGLWSVLPSETVGDTLADPAIPGTVFSAVVALMVQVAQNPWLEESHQSEHGANWREILVRSQTGVTCGIAEYYINEVAHNVVLTRIVIVPETS